MTTTNVTRVCKVCGVEQPITSFRPVHRIDAQGQRTLYHLNTCITCTSIREKARYTMRRAGAVHCRVCTILLHVDGPEGNDLAVAVAHGHGDRCETCAGCEPLVDREVLVPARGEMAVLMFPDYWTGKTA